MTRSATSVAAVLVLAAPLLAYQPGGKPPCVIERSTAPAMTGTLLVVNKHESTASIIDLATGDAVVTLPTGVGPHECATSPDGSIGVVSDYGSHKAGSTLTVIDMRRGVVLRTIDLDAPRRPHGIAWLPGGSGHRVLVTSEVTKSVIEVDVGSGEIVREIATDQPASHMVAATADGTRAFVPNLVAGTVSVLDLAAGKTLKVVASGDEAEGLAITPDERELWVANRAADSLTVFDLTTLERVAEVPCADFPLRVAALPDNRTLLVACTNSNEIAVIDRVERKEVRRIANTPEAAPALVGDMAPPNMPAGSMPGAILLHPDRRHALVSNMNSYGIGVLDLRTWAFVGVLKAGFGPDGMAYSGLPCRPEQPQAGGE